jgi:hypothetical protein
MQYGVAFCGLWFNQIYTGTQFDNLTLGTVSLLKTCWWGSMMFANSYALGLTGMPLAFSYGCYCI